MDVQPTSLLGSDMDVGTGTNWHCTRTGASESIGVTSDPAGYYPSDDSQAESWVSWFPRGQTPTGAEIITAHHRDVCEGVVPHEQRLF